MTMKRKLGAYGGVGSIFGIVGIILIAKGSGTTRLVGVLVIALGVFGISMFDVFLKHKLKRADDWLEGRTEGGAWLSWFRGTANALHSRKIEKDAAMEVKESGRLAAANALVQKVFKKILDAARPKEKVIGEKLAAIEQGAPAGEKTLDLLDTENQVFMKTHARSVKQLREKHLKAKELIDDLRKKTPDLKKKAKDLEKQIAEYGELWEKGVDHQKRLQKIRSIEQMIDDIKAEEITKAVKEFAEAEKHAERLTGIGESIQDSIKNLREDISEKHRDDNYQTLQKLLEEMEDSVEGKLAQAVAQHKEASAFYFQTLHRLNDDVRDLTRLEIHEMRAEHKLKIEAADAARAAAEKRGNDLEARLNTTTREKEEWKATAEKRAQKLGNLKDLMDKWSSDLDAARAEAKKNPKMESKVAEVLGKDLVEMSGFLTLLVSTLNARDSHVDKVKQELKETQERKAALETQKSALETEKSEKEKEIETAKEANRLLDEEKTELTERIERETKAAREAGETEVGQKKDAELAELRDRLSKVEAEKTAAETEIKTLNKNLRGSEEKIKEIQTSLDAINDKIPALEAEAKEAKAERDKVKKDAETLKKDTDAKILELEGKADRLRNRIKELEHNTGNDDLLITTLKMKLKEEERKVRAAETAAGKAGKDAAVWKIRHDEIEAGKRVLQEAFEKETADRQRLAEELEKKATALAEKTTLLEGLEQVQKTEAEIKAEEAARKQAEDARIQRAIKDKQDEIDELKLAMKQLEGEVSDNEEVKEELARVKADLENARKILEGLQKTKKENLDDITKALEAKTRAETEARNLGKELDDARRQHAAAMAELQQETEGLKTEAQQMAEELDEIRGRHDEFKRKEDELLDRLQRINVALLDKEEEIHKALEANDPSAAERAKSERNDMIRQELILMAEEGETGESLLTLSKRVHGTAKRLLFTFNNFRISAESELAALTDVVESKEGTIKTIAEKMEFLEKSKIPELERQISEALRTQQVTPEGLQSMRMELAALREESKIDTAIKQDLKGEVEAAKIRIAELTHELAGLKGTHGEQPVVIDESIEPSHEPTLASRISDEPEFIIEDSEMHLIPDADQEVIARDRAEWFRKTIIEPVENKKAEAVNLSQTQPRTELAAESALTSIEEAIHMLNQQEKSYAGQFHEDEEKAIRDLHATLKIVRENMLRGLERVKEAAHQPAAPPPVPADAKTSAKGGPYRGDLHAQPSVIIDMPPKLKVVGDAHGDVDIFKNLLIKAKIIDKSERWILERDTKVVFLGDYIDRFEKSFEVLDLTKKLKQQAGNNLKLLIGNHEAMFLAAFDWKGYDNTAEGKQLLAWYLKRKAKFEASLIKVLEKSNIKLTDAEKLQIPRTLFTKYAQGMKNILGLFDKLISKWKFKDIKELYLRLEICKESWINNDKLNTLNVLNLKLDDVTKDSRHVVEASYKGKPVRHYLEFMRDNLELAYLDEDDKVLYIHAGIPYEATNSDSIDFAKAHNFKGYIHGSKLSGLLSNMQRAIRNREVLNWMAYSETSPLFACHPYDRNKEWDILPGFKDEMVLADFKLNAVVFGHSRHKPQEERHKVEYQGKLRHSYNIDFGMSTAYGQSHGGWLEVNAEGKMITVFVMDHSDTVREYEYHFKPGTLQQQPQLQPIPAKK